MSFKSEFGDKAAGLDELAKLKKPAGSDVPDAELEQALSSFRLSVRAWSEAELSRPRMAAAAGRRRAWRRTWRLAAGWALGCALAMGGVSGGVYERHHRQELARIAAQRETERQRQLAAEQAREEEDLLAKVDSDISRAVPSAMEPLAQLMGEDESK